MNQYEIVFILNPQQSAESKLFEKCQEQIKSSKGLIHRTEDIGSRDLAYPINDCNKGHYFLINFELEPSELVNIESLFKFNEAILRSALVKKRTIETEPSALLTQTKEKQAETKKYSESRRPERSEIRSTEKLEIKEAPKKVEGEESTEKKSEAEIESSKKSEEG
jgi:small subunit ribosomal protein S6